VQVSELSQAESQAWFTIAPLPIPNSFATERLEFPAAFSFLAVIKGGFMDERIDCWCETCKAHVTLKEIIENFHAAHEFAVLDRAALQAVQEYLNRTEAA
jgi:hypothetical protein